MTVAGRTRTLRAAATALAAGAILACATPGGPTERVKIPPGASLRIVSDTLVAHGIVTHPRWFRFLARVRGMDRVLQAGVYQLPRKTGSWQVLTALTTGRVATVRFTVPEGLTVLELADLAQSRLSIPRDSLVRVAFDSSEAHSAGLPPGGFEGFLMPETYQVPAGSTARDLLRMMTQQFQEAWQPGWNARLDSLGLTLVQLVALASIVEGEARHAEERPIIAGVYWNRLRRGIALQADPTVQYAIQLKTGERKTRLYFKDYDTPSIYNTYLHPGLPPGPVDSPGKESLAAALYPADVPFLYFVARPDGHHVFSRTIDEHNRAVAQIRAEERRRRRAFGAGTSPR